MNGSILGMRKHEIDKHFDDIVEFSGVEGFLDTPLKRYSSGMQLRLAFAVAAHLEPEILVIDEVLAVGDADFQKKCLGKMNDISKSGRTIIFVSHDMNAIERLCDKAIILQKGVLEKEGEAHTLVAHYLNTNRITGFSPVELIENITLVEFSFEPAEIISGDDINFTIGLQLNGIEAPSISDFCLLIYSAKGVRVTIIDLRPFIQFFTKKENKLTLRGKVENMNLVEGEYSVGLFSVINETRKEILDINQIRIKPGLNSHSQVKPYLSHYRGHLELMDKIKLINDVS
jgi:lipopolysaccharide transport system ATP-binding protein